MDFMLLIVWRRLMKLNDFFEKSPKPRSVPQKIITVSNEKKEAELTEELTLLQQEVDRLHTVDSERSDFNQRMQAAEIQLHEMLEREVELKAANTRFTKEIEDRGQVWEENQTLKGEVRDLKGNVGIQEAILEQSKKNNLTLNVTAESLTEQVKHLQSEETSLARQLEEARQHSSASLNSLQEVLVQRDDANRMFQAIEVQYIEGQRKNSDVTQQAMYWQRLAKMLQEEKDELEKTRHMLKTWASNVEADNIEKKGAVKVTQSELKKLRGTVGNMTMNLDGLIQENKELSSFNSALKSELSRPKYMSMAAIERSEGFKLPTGGYRKHFLGNSKPTLLKFKVKEGGNDN